MQSDYDVVVIGSGVASSAVAHRAAAAGRRVLVVDDRPFGGTCPLRGCDPKKVLRAGAEVADMAARLAERGIVTDGTQIDCPSLMAFKRSFTEPVPHHTAECFAKAGIGAVQGTAHFTGRETLDVDGHAVAAGTVVVAPGAEPVPLPIEGAEHLATSDEVLDLDHLPRRIVFVGGGYIAFELVHITARCGAEATIVERGARPLAPFNATLVEQLVDYTSSTGVTVLTRTTVRAAERHPRG